MEEVAGLVYVDDFLSGFIFESMLGCSYYSRVYKVVERATNHAYSLKVIIKNVGVAFEPGKLKTFSVFEGESNIVFIRYVFEDEMVIITVSELASDIDLYSYILQTDVITEGDISMIISHILTGLTILHREGVVHRNLKPSNIFVSLNYEPPLVRLADYGFGDAIDNNHALSELSSNSIFTSPEVFSHETYSEQSDMWSLGVILYILLTGSRPFPYDEKYPLFTSIKEGVVPYPAEDWDYISESARDLVSRMLVLDPEARITAEEALAHPWITGIDGDIPSTPLVAMQEKLQLLSSIRSLQRIMGAAKSAKNFRKFTALTQSTDSRVFTMNREEDTPTDNSSDN